VSNKEKPSFFKCTVEFLDYPFLGMFVKIDHYISAEYDLKSSSGRKGLHEIQSSERDHFTQLWFDPVIPAALIDTPLEVAAP